jgi:hypothetical protein
MKLIFSNENLQDTASRAIIVPPTPSTRPLEQLHYSIDVDYSYNIVLENITNAIR